MLNIRGVEGFECLVEVIISEYDLCNTWVPKIGKQKEKKTKPLNTALKAIMLHTSGVQVELLFNSTTLYNNSVQSSTPRGLEGPLARNHMHSLVFSV